MNNIKDPAGCCGNVKSGFVSIMGPTNAGKSTLLNAIMGRKVSIVSHKVQTTRTQLRAVKMIPSPQSSGAACGETQLIFTDTPGIFNPKRKLDKAMVGAAIGSLAGADAVLLIVDATNGITKTIKELIKKIGITPVPHRGGASVFAFINKSDAVKKQDLLPMIAELSQLARFQEIFIGSALENDLGGLLSGLAAAMPDRPAYLYDPKDATDVPAALWLAEITREKVYKHLHQELPYDIYIATEKIETDTDGVLEIYQKIVVKSDNHKKIVIGRGGTQLKKIGTDARHEIQDEWGVNARLHLFVRVEPDWQDKAEGYEAQGLSLRA